MARVTHLNLMHRGADGAILNADDMEYDNSGSGLTATQLQAAVDELAGMVGGGTPRTVHDLLLNKTGGTVNAGDVVILDPANDQAFITTTTAAIETGIGVVEDASIANNAYGYVVTYGLAFTVNTGGASVTRGHYLFTSTTPKQATGSGTRGAGAFGQFISTNPDADAWIWGVGDLVPGGGSHTHVYSEVPSGTINGSNDTFTLAATPTSGTLRLYKNGLRQKAGAGNDYTLATATITFLSGNIPVTGDNLLADYE